MKRVAAGVVGVGRLGREHTRVLSDLSGARLAGVHDVVIERGRAVAEEFGTRHHESLDGLLEAVDAVVVAVPTEEHYAVTRAALEAGCHALVEKPLTAKLEEADALLELAEERGLELGVGHIERFNSVVRASRPHLDDPRFVESLRLAPFQPRGTDVPVVLDLMIHDIDLVLDLVESPVESLHAVGTPVLTDMVDIANARLMFENGSVAEITASRVSERRVRSLRMFQRTGYLRLDLAAEKGEFLRRRDDVPGASGHSTLSDLVERVPVRSDGQEPLRLELSAFLRAARGHPSPMVSAREGRDALKIALRINSEIEQAGDVPVETA